MTPVRDEGLLGRLQREADDAVADCLTAAREQAATLRDAAIRDADAHRHAVLVTRAREHRQARATAHALAQQRAVRETLRAREGAVEGVLRAAIASADTLAAHPDLLDALRTDIAQAMQHLPDAPVIVRCPPSIEHTTREAAAQVDATRTTVTVDPTLAMGIVVQSSDGRVEVNATVARRIAGQRRRLAIRVAQLLVESFT